ncbi:Glycosyltransferase family 2 protein [Mycena chlorophos]|uniref:Glycosyltransferase family 2 protein n=1 Tax=Mycena chlorophos TaxID=658473 RepID=A0A8H6RVU6_MYCCL|nr:Glycosyltransferase family 2 protein [Mycena chlorophos]
MVEASQKRWGNHSSFKTGGGLDRAGFPTFTINHFNGPVAYSSENFLERNIRGMNPDFAINLQGHPRNKDTIVAAQQSVEPMRAPSKRPDIPEEEEPAQETSDAAIVAGDFRASLDFVFATLEETQAFCINPNDSQLPTQLEGRSVKGQVRSTGLAQIAQRNKTVWEVGMLVDEFCERYAAALEVGGVVEASARERVEQARTAFGLGARDVALGIWWTSFVQLAVALKERMHGIAHNLSANTKFSRGYAATGVVMGVCACHELVQPTGVADLQAGERFANINWILAAILRHISIRLNKIIFMLPPLMRLGLVLELNVFLKQFVFVVPKLHVLGHTALCQLLYLLNFVLGGGQTDREGIERPWGWIGGIAAGQARAIGARAPVWKAMVLAYEKDTVNNPNPYKATTKEMAGQSKLQVREEIEAAEEADAAKGQARVRVGRVGPAEFIIEFLDLENEQRRVGDLAALKKAKSTSMKINQRSLRCGINRRLEVLLQLQATYMPASLQRLHATNLPESTLAEEVPPSALSDAERGGGGCLQGLLEMERKLRDAQCRMALVSLRHQLLLKWRILRFMNEHARGQATTTRSLSNAARNENKILLYSRKYQGAWLALVCMADGDEKVVAWPQLRKEDIRCLEDGEEVARKTEKAKRLAKQRAHKQAQIRAAGETTLTMAWPQRTSGNRPAAWREFADDIMDMDAGWDIWHVEMEEGLLSDAARWDEEVLILEEEQRCVTESFESFVWETRAVAIPIGTLPVEDAEGLVAYALKRAAVYKNLAARAESTRTKPKLRRGQKRPRYQPLQVSFEEAVAEVRNGLRKSWEVPVTTLEPTGSGLAGADEASETTMDWEAAGEGNEDEDADGWIEEEKLDEQGSVSDDELVADIEDW